MIKGYKTPIRAPKGPNNNINAALGPDNPVVWTLIFHFAVIKSTTPVFTE